MKKRMHDQFLSLYEKGVRRFLVGGELGVDQWAGEIILRLKEQPEYSDIELVVVLPFPGHDEQWDARSRERLAVSSMDTKCCHCRCNAKPNFYQSCLF